MFQRIAVCGLGLLGGSLCRSIKKNYPSAHIIVCDPNTDAVEVARAEGIIDGSFTLDDALFECTLAVAAVPVGRSAEVLRRMLEKTSHACLIIDVGSVKEEIINALRNAPGFERFIPCHPMAGSERSGYGFSRDDLFCGASVIMTPHEMNSPSAVSSIHAFWRELGANVTSADAGRHDRMTALTSHLPHLLSSALLQTASAGGMDAMRPFSGKGLHDMTRLAGGSPLLWRDIFIMNAENVKDALDAYIALLTEFRENLMPGDDAERYIYAFLEKGSVLKKEFENEKNHCRR